MGCQSSELSCLDDSAEHHQIQMADLYCIVASHTAWVHNNMWPVCYRLSREEAETVLNVCEEQRDKFIAELQPVWSGLRDANRTWARSRGKRIPRKQALEADELARAARRRLLDQEIEINARYAAEMLDPLFPTSTNSTPNDWPPKVLYKIIEFWDDPRQMGPAELMRLRAKLHGGSSDDDDDGPSEE